MKWGPNMPPTFKNRGPLKHNDSLHLSVTNNSNVLFRFSEGHSAAQLSYLCGILQNCAGMSQCRALDPSLRIVCDLNCEQKVVEENVIMFTS